MNTKSKFQEIAEQIKILFEHNIDYKIIADVLKISKSTITNYKRKLEKKYKITLVMTSNKSINYPKLLDSYAKLYLINKAYPHGVGILNPAQKTLIQTIEKMIDFTILKYSLNRASMFGKYLQVPKIENEPSIILQNYAKLIEKILHIDILVPNNNEELINDPFSEIMQAIVEKKIDLTKVNSTEDLIVNAIGFLANNVDRKKINTSTLDENKIFIIFNSMLLQIREREANIISLYFGLDKNNPKCLTLEEIGDIFDLSRERVRQIKEKVIRRLKYNPKYGLLLDALNVQQ